MIGIEPIVLIEEAIKIALTQKYRRAVDAMAIETVLTGRIRKFDHFDFVPTDGGFYLRGCLRVIDDDQMLDIPVGLSSDAFDCAQDARIARCRRHNSDEWVARAHSTPLGYRNESAIPETQLACHVGVRPIFSVKSVRHCKR